MIERRNETMFTNCYQIAFENATNEIAEINAQIQKLARRKELLEKLVEPLRTLVSASESFANHAAVSDDSNSQSANSTADTHASQAGILVDVFEAEPGPLEGSAAVTQPDVDEANLQTERNGGPVSHADVAGLAYRFWNERGRVHGHHEADWFRATHELQNSA
jgi:hypothetical protein